MIYPNLKGLLLLTLFFSSCRSIEVTNTWKLPVMPQNGIKRILVMGIHREPDRSTLYEMERHLSEGLRARGYQAFSAFSEYGPQVFDRITEEEALHKLERSGYDAVMTIVLLDKEKERHYVPGHVNYTPYAFYYGRFWGYRTVLFNRVVEPGYYVTDTKYFWESNLYSLKRGEVLLFSAQSRSFDPPDASEFGRRYAKTMVDLLFSQGVLE